MSNKILIHSKYYIYSVAKFLNSTEMSYVYDRILTNAFKFLVMELH